MGKIRGKDTKPELLVRKKLFALGFRYRLHDKNLPGSPDIILPRYNAIIMVHGCFWHGHENCRSFHLPKSRITFWKAKIERNRQRDKEVNGRLRKIGWRVITVWECQLTNNKIENTIKKISKRILK